jgi:predicted metal-binding protein
MIKKLIDFIKGLFCKNCSIKAEAVVVKPTVSEELQEKLEKKEKDEALAEALVVKAKVVKKKRNADNQN